MSVESSSTVVGKVPCPKCRENGEDSSGDNLVMYDDGHGYCFACRHYVPPKGEGEDDDGVEDSRPATKSKAGDLITNGDYQRLAARGITEDTCRFLGYQVGEDRLGRKVQIANYYDEGGRIVAQHLRRKGKKFAWAGDAKKAGLFGQHKFRGGGKRLVITEGEIDALSISQLQGNKWPVVSVPNGAAGAAKTISEQIEFVESFETVVFAFDMDEPGRAAAKECAALLTPGKAAIAFLPMKDANECLLNGKGKELLDALWNAKPYRPDGVVDVASLIEKACKPIEVGRSWPWPTLTKHTYGRRRRELYGFGGGTGCGKSTVFKQIALHIIEEDNLPVGMLMLEEPPSHTLKTLAGMKMQKRVHVPGVEFDPKELEDAVRSLDGKVFFYDHFGSATFETIVEKIRYMVRALGIRDIFLDHLTALAASIEDDERKAIDKIMAELSSLTQELDCTIYYISHLSTPDGKPHEEGGRVLEKHFRGSRSIGYWSHFLFAIERDKQDTDGVTCFRVLKDRYTGDANGVTFGLEYSRETGLLSECELPSDSNSAEAHGFRSRVDVPEDF